MSQGTNRRNFLKGTAAAGVGFWVANRALGQDDSKSPNERLNFASVGVGGKGDGDSEQAAKFGNMVAICDTDDKTLDRKAQQFPKAKKFNDFRKMFDAMGKEIDGVTVSTADHCHAVVAMMGIKNGKHVYCQKPLTHSIYEARRLREEAEKHKVATQMGNQGTAENGLREAVELIQAGGLGNVREVHVWTNRPIWPQAPQIVDRPMESQPVPSNLHWDEWLGPAPERPYNSKYQPFNWRGWMDFGTGALGDMGCHTANLPFMALKLNETYPTAVYAESGVLNTETYPAWASVTYEFPARGDMPPLKFHWYEGHKGKLHNWPSLELIEGEKMVDSGAIVVGDTAILYSPNDYGANYKILPLPGQKKLREFEKPQPTLPRNGGGDEGMKREWVAAIKGGPPAMSNFNYSGKLTEFILLGNVAIRAGFRRLEYDGPNMKVTNFDEANEFIRREYRKGYEV